MPFLEIRREFPESSSDIIAAARPGYLGWAVSALAACEKRNMIEKRTSGRVFCSRRDRCCTELLGHPVNDDTQAR
jgi:hypothetical protein